MDLLFFFKVDRGQIQTFSEEGENRGTQIQRLNFIENKMLHVTSC